MIVVPPTWHKKPSSDNKTQETFIWQQNTRAPHWWCKEKKFLRFARRPRPFPCLVARWPDGLAVFWLGRCVARWLGGLVSFACVDWFYVISPARLAWPASGGNLEDRRIGLCGFWVVLAWRLDSLVASWLGKRLDIYFAIYSNNFATKHLWTFLNL